MDELPSPFRVDMKTALLEMAASYVVFATVYGLGFGGEGAIFVAAGSQFAARLWRKGFFYGAPEKRVDDRHIPIVSVGHALAWLNIAFLGAAAAILEGHDPKTVIGKVVWVAFLLSLVVASRFAWELIWSKVNR